MGHHAAAFTLSRSVTLSRSDAIGIDMSWQDKLDPSPSASSDSCPAAEISLNHGT
jgi:hypothetical protein